MADKENAAVADQLGRTLRHLRVSVIDNCNFRCPYCMPAQIYGDAYRFLGGDELLTFEEIERVVRVVLRLGAAKVKLTGGEPLLRPWLPDLVRRLAALDGLDDLGLITNGLHLARMAATLYGAGLRRLTVSLDTPDPATFALMSGRGHRVEAVLEGIEAAERAGFGAVKINAVVVRGMNDHQVVDLVRRFRGTPHTVRFIECMDVGNRNGWRPELVVPSAELVRTIGGVWPLEPVSPEYPGEVATRYRFRDGGGEVGFISSVSVPFCGGCTRLRLSAGGTLYTCLFATKGLDLRAPLRSGATDEELQATVAGLWRGRSDRYSELRARERARAGDPKVEMFAVGG